MLYRQNHSWVLASASPRRKAFLQIYDFAFVVDPADADESQKPAEGTEEYTQRLAYQKAELVAARHPPEAVIIAADTTVEKDGMLFGKPETPGDAYRTLTILNGAEHRVVTSFCVMRSAEQKILLHTASTKVLFYEHSPELLRAYANSLEAQDKAGCYSIQGLGGALVKSIVGSFPTVVGFPIEVFLQEMLTIGWITPR